MSNAVGFSGHKNAYSQGVKIGNWVEEKRITEVNGKPSRLGWEAKPLSTDTTYKGGPGKERESQEYGEALKARDPNPSQSCIETTLLFGHGAVDSLSKTRFASLNRAAFVDPRDAKNRVTAIVEADEATPEGEPQYLGNLARQESRGSSVPNPNAARFVTTKMIDFTQDNSIMNPAVKEERLKEPMKTNGFSAFRKEVDSDGRKMGLRSGELCYRTVLCPQPEWC